MHKMALSKIGMNLIFHVTMLYQRYFVFFGMRNHRTMQQKKQILDGKRSSILCEGL